jgi:hypothetical protein
MWTTFTNLTGWFDSWGSFIVMQGFAMKVNGESGEGAIITDEQKRRIINIDETNLSVHGSDGGRGSRPAT